MMGEFVFFGLARSWQRPTAEAATEHRSGSCINCTSSGSHLRPKKHEKIQSRVEVERGQNIGLAIGERPLAMKVAEWKDLGKRRFSKMDILAVAYSLC